MKINAIACHRRMHDAKLSPACCHGLNNMIEDGNTIKRRHTIAMFVL